MQYRALVSFSGTISMATGQVSEIADESVAKDLVRAGYVIPLSAEKHEAVVKEPEKNVAMVEETAEEIPEKKAEEIPEIKAEKKPEKKAVSKPKTQRKGK